MANATIMGSSDSHLINNLPNNTEFDKSNFELPTAIARTSQVFSYAFCSKSCRKCLCRKPMFALLKKKLVSHVSYLTPRTMKVNSEVTRKRWTQAITPNIRLTSREKIDFTEKKANITKLHSLIVLLEYMNAKGKHIQKITYKYLDRGFDVLQISLKPSQLLFPVKGSQVVAKDLADFLLVNQSFSPLVIHGFSVGGYVWGETLVHFLNDLDKYQPVVNRIVGQIFDSPADIESIPTAFPASLFPNNVLLQTSFSQYLRLHMSLFFETATKHYYKSREVFTSGLVKAPILFITSNADDLSSPSSVIKAKDEVTEKNLEASVRIFDGSRHVMHFKAYPTAYFEEVDNFLQKIKLLNIGQLKAKL